MCQVTVSHTATRKSGAIEVYYPEDGATISERTATRLEEWASGRRRIYGYASTDACGSTDYNRSLGHARLKSVASVVPLAKGVNLGEATHTHNPYHRRVVLVDADYRISRLLAQYPSDYYLIDASGSMSDEWGQVITFPYPRRAKVYVAKTYGCRSGQHINTIQPGGHTEIWYPYWKLLTDARPGSTITIISDFRSTYPLSGWEYDQIEAIARQKNITVYVIKYRG
jgi:hypothetical protein